MIPTKIYYVWFGHNPLPDNVKKNIQTWKNNNPTYQIIQIDESNYDINQHPFVAQAYASKQWAFASDVARLDIIYRYGGFYFDTDVKMIKPLDSLSLRNYSGVWAMETVGSVNSGLILGAEKGNEDLAALLDIYSKLKFDPTKLDDFITTGILSSYFLKKGLKKKNKKQLLPNNTIVFSSPYFAPYHWWGGGHISKKTIAIQQYTKNWGEKLSISNHTKLVFTFRHYTPRLFDLVYHKILKR